MSKKKTLRDEDRAARMAEVLRLNLIEGKGVNAIHRATGLDRKTVRTLLGSARGEQDKPKPSEPRASILDPYDADIRQALEDCPEIHAPAVLDRLRAKGYEGGISVLRERV